MVELPLNKTKANPVYFIYLYKEDLALNNLKWLKSHYTEPNPTTVYFVYMYKEDLELIS